MQTASRSATNPPTYPERRRRSWREAIGFTLVAVALLLTSAQSAFAANGTAVVAKLQTVSGIVKTLTGALGVGGAFSQEENAGSIPFLGGAPGRFDPSMFNSMFSTTTGLGKLDAISIANDKALSEVKAILDPIPGVTATYMCDAVECATDAKVEALTSIVIDYKIGGTGSAGDDKDDFSSLNLPSISFLPGTPGELNISLSWSVNLRLTVTEGGVAVSRPESAHMLELGLGLTLPKTAFAVNLGALIVQATVQAPNAAPGFSGTVYVDLEGQDLKFGFKDGAKFEAKWHLATTDDSPLRRIEADLNVLWNLGGATDAGVDPAGLEVAVENVKLWTGDFMGDGLQKVAQKIRDVVHPIRQATSPMLEPIPGLSDFSDLVAGEEVTMLRLMGLARGIDPGSGLDKLPYEKLEEAFKRIQFLDDATASLAGEDGFINLGSFTLAKSEALKSNGAPAVAAFKKITELCAECATQLGNLLEKVNGSRDPESKQGFNFEVPVMSDPASLAGLILGRDVDLITFDSGFLGYKGKIDSPIARFFIFAVKIKGEITAGVHIKGGVDTRGIIDAIDDGAKALLNGVYLENPGGDDAVLTLTSKAGLELQAGIDDVGISIRGAPVPDIRFKIPANTKLRPALLEGTASSIGCKLVDGGAAEFSVRVSAFFDYWLDSEEEVLADHTFLTRKDICDEAANDTPLAEYDNNGSIEINPAAFNSLPIEQPALLKVYMVHKPNKDPLKVVVEGNDGRYAEINVVPGLEVVRLNWPTATRPIYIRVVKNDGLPFELKVDIRTGEMADDVLVDSSKFGRINVGAGNDRVMVASGVDPNAPGIPVSGGPGDDLLVGSNKTDFLQGDEGNDNIQGGGGNDRLDGGPDTDVIADGSVDTDTSDGIGRNCLIGGSGSDLLISGFGGDMLFGDETRIVGDNAVDCGGGNPDPEEPDVTGDGNDTILTGGGTDFVIAGGGNDTVKVEGKGAYQGNDPAWKAGLTVHGNGGNDTIWTGFGTDTIHGGAGVDDIESDTGPTETLLRAGAADSIWGGLDGDIIHSSGGNDVVFGDNGHDSCSATYEGEPVETANLGGADKVYGGNGDDVIALEAGDDFAYGEDADDVICGHAGVDTIYGDDEPDSNPLPFGDGAGADTIFGGTSGDNLYGGLLDDLVMGNSGSDFLYGEDGDDRLIGGANKAGTLDTGDSISGGDGSDVIVGDNGAITGATPRVVHVFDLFANDPSLGGPDLISGDDGADRAFGGLGGDTMTGGTADDMLQGNNGDDSISGNGGDDDIIGGTSDEALPGATAGQAAADAPDTGETILSGGAGLDVIIGDNGDIIRPGGTDPILGGPARAVVLFDRDRTGTALAAVSGGDYIEGNADSDRIYGQGGDDYLKGNDADDYVEGNQGGDRLEGNDGEDDLVGGSSFLASAGVGDPDGSDQLAGGAGADVLLGDNAAITRATTGSGAGFDWDSVANSWLGQVARRSITLFDKQALTIGNYGDDVLSGGAGADVLFGQDGVDRLFGGADDDYMEGNGAGDVLFGDQNAGPTGNAHESPALQLDGAPGPDGQDDQVGGSSWVRNRTGSGAISGQRDAADELHGDGNADVQLGDNGRILRVIADGEYATFEALTGKPTFVRQASPTGTAPTALPARFDVGAAAADGVWGADTLFGDAGDDVQLAGDGDDSLYGGADDDDMYGELGDDRMFGEAGEDAMVGDRGVIANRLVTTPGATISVSNPPSMSFTPFAAHPLDRRVDLNDDGDGAPRQAPGMTTGGNDYLRGGADHDAMHGAAGNDLMNGDGGGDYLFGADGADVLWGGQGRECADPADLDCNGDRGADDRYVDYLFGGNGLRTDPVTGGADVLDYRPRPGSDPVAWFEATNTRGTDPTSEHQHHQGIDWIYGGWDRDVMQADIADNGPNPGDRLMDWTGAYNLYTHCPSAYGGYNDVRLFSPTLQTFLQELAFSLGAGQSLADVQTVGTSGYNELALVFTKDVKANSGSAYPGTPGHFDDFSCAP